ncbi:MAG: TonB-dependent receptor [Fluviicola sp. XM-24bin1]|nr:MAG: TonB-dependent receptor [Fluviicola sp. XM-24bin1]
MYIYGKSILMLVKSILLNGLFLLTFLTVQAQESVVSGVVTDDKSEPLVFVSVSIKGLNKGTFTDGDGKFSIPVPNPATDTLIFRLSGYLSQEIPVNGQSTVDLQMFSEINEIDQVIVVGYGESSTKEYTGATSKVGGEDIEKMNQARVDQALQGQVAGVNISTNSGSPGGSANIRIRGLSTFGDNDPLILVDGVVYDAEGLNALNPSDIKSINVLKDATAGIYGVRAANGVILIETKTGRLNAAPKIEYNGYYGIQETAKRLDLLEANEYAVIKNEAFAFGGQPVPFNNVNLGRGTNWQDSVFTRSPVQSHNISMTGGSANTRYSIGLGYFTQDGIVGGDKAHFSRYNARLNLSTELAKNFRLNSVFLFSHDYRNVLPENGIGSVLYNTINAFPNEPIRTADGNYSYLEEVSDIINPIAQIENQYNWSWADKFVGKEEFIYDFNEHLTFTNRFNYNYAIVDNKAFSPLVWYGDGKFANTALNADLESPQVEIADSVFIERGASVWEERASFLDLTFESFMNYDRTIKEGHRIKGTAGITVFQRKGESLSGTAFGIPNNSLEFADISANTAEGGFLNNVGSWEFKERLLSAFLRGEYQLKRKYFFSAVIRADGSSKFGPNNRWGYFPSGSAAWLLSDEEFFDVKWMDFAKVRLSYGIMGNDQIENFAYRALLNGEGVYVIDDVITPGVAIGKAGNPDLKWETTRQFNFGVDVTMWKQLDVTANYFFKNTNDLLFQPDVTAILGTYGPGGFPPIVNAGNVSNNGVELELAYSLKEKEGRKLFANVNFNFTYLRNRVTAVPDGVDFIPGANFGVGGVTATRFEVGQEIGYFHGFETAGIFQTQEEIDNHPVIQEGAEPGDLIFVDQNGDGVINFSDDSDKTNLGSPIPDFTMGFGMNFRYKGWDLSATLYAALGQEIIRNFERQQPYANQLDYVIDRWTGPGTSNVHPRLTTGPTRNTEFSSYYVEDGDFLRVRNLQIGYSLPSAWINKANIDRVRIYVSVNNLWTFTRYQGYDPDVGSGSVLSAGVDYGIYPQARTFIGGLQIGL